jgi:predicted O-methyltransferase YrrM
MTFEEIITRVQEQSKNLVWWSPSQIARGDDIANDPTKGERPWSVPEATGRFLHETVSELQPKIILELGTSIGYSTLWMAHAAAAYDGHIHTIEMKPEKYALAQKNIKDAGFESVVTFHHAMIMDVIENLQNILGETKIDFIFMDADRGHYHEYFPLIKKHLSKKALLIADNAGNMQGRMTPFLKLLEQEGWACEIKEMDNGILVAKR